MTPESLGTLRARLSETTAMSFWGHTQTLALANELCGMDLTPARERPALTVGPAGLPSLDGQEVGECWVVAPEYTAGYRPAPGEAVAADRIVGWQVLKLLWEEE